MNAYHNYLNQLLSKNKKEYSGYPELKWLNAYTAQNFEEIRTNYLKVIDNQVLYNQTKPFYKQISNGCQLCGNGLWSCLFITGKCNANCFYCPTSQEQDELPTTQGLTFPTAESYAEYVAYFSFKGVSFSGGEPLLVKERVLEYLKALRKAASPEIYTWMYTNGILANAEIFRKLAAYNLNEVRFDIGAINYDLSKIKQAKGIIKNLTIEIPAVPEEKDRLIKLLPDIIKAGVTNLNLHQLRLTPYNVSKLSKRDYTLIAAEKPIVLESELAALEIINYAKTHQLEIGINYCSFFFKNRFQPAGIRTILAKKLDLEQNRITEKGYIHKKNAHEINYQTIRIADENSLPNKASILQLEHKKYDFWFEIAHKIEKPDTQILLEIGKMETGEPYPIPESEIFFEIWKHERIESGLREY